MKILKIILKGIKMKRPSIKDFIKVEYCSFLSTIENLNGNELNSYLETIIDFSKIFRYDESSETGIIWNININNSKIGNKAGTLGRYGNNGKRYIVGIFGYSFKVHRVIWILHNGNIEPGNIIDHIDIDSTNNRISNLRSIQRKLNNRNLRIRSNSKTGVTGVVKYTDKYGYESYIAYWVDSSNKTKTKRFSINKYGEEIAFELAVSSRNRAIESLKESGVFYGENHAKYY